MEISSYKAIPVSNYFGRIGLSPGGGHCSVFLGKTRYSHSASHSVYPPRCINGYRRLNAWRTQHPIQKEVEILLVHARYRNQDKRLRQWATWLV